MLVVLMLVAVIGTIAAVSLERMKLSARQSLNMAATDQARAYGYTAEAIALSRIADLVGRDATKTTLAGDWQARDIRFTVEGGAVSAKLLDGGNCFNLNSAVEGEADKLLSARPVGIEQFVALMTIVGVREIEARPIALALADWIDSDTVPLPGGAEDAVYARAKIPYRTANSLMVDASELRVLAGMTPQIYALVRPWVCALPVTDLSPLNANTLLPAQAPLVAMLMPRRLGVATARAMINARPQTGFGNVLDFWALPARSGITAPAEALAQTRIKSRWFALDLTVELAGAELRETGLVDAGSVPARLVRRSYGDSL